jgi:hypothetical protein
LLPDLEHAADEDVVDESGFDCVTGDDVFEDVTEEHRGMDPGQGTPWLALTGSEPEYIDENSFTH